MNREYILWNLQEARQQVDEIVQALAVADYDEPEVLADMSHLYHHLNTAWNARHASKAATDGCSQEDFDRWRQMPTDRWLES